MLCAFFEIQNGYSSKIIFLNTEDVLCQKRLLVGDLCRQKGRGGVNQWLIKTFVFLIDNRCEVCYTVGVIKSQIQPKEAIIMMKIYINRMSYVSPAVC